MLPMTLIKHTRPAVRILPLLIFPLLLSGCGLTQSVSDGTSSAMKSLFYKQVKTLHLDITAREALNTDTRENTSLSEPVMVRVYQLKDRKTFDKAVYQQLANDAENVLGADLLASRSLVVKPGADASLDMPVDENAQAVAVIGLFRQPDQAKNDWKLLLTRDDLDPDAPRIIEAGNNRLTLQPLKGD